MTATVENYTAAAEVVTLRLLRNGQQIDSWRVNLAGQEKKQLALSYSFTRADKPAVVLGVEAVASGDLNPADNLAEVRVKVR